jgi:hypothetical protein
MSDQLALGPFGTLRSPPAEVAQAVAAFCAKFRNALTRRDCHALWAMLTGGSQELYQDDPTRFAETLSQLDPVVLGGIAWSSVSGGKVVPGRIICNFKLSTETQLPPLVLFQDGVQLRVDYRFDLSPAGLAYFGALKVQYSRERTISRAKDASQNRPASSELQCGVAK